MKLSKSQIMYCFLLLIVIFVVNPYFFGLFLKISPFLLIPYLFFIGKNKSEMYFFKEFFNENKCIALHQFNELLVEFDITKCKF